MPKINDLFVDFRCIRARCEREVSARSAQNL